MKQWGFRIALVLSLLILALLSLGYCAKFSLGLVYQKAFPQRPLTKAIRIIIHLGTVKIFHLRRDEQLTPVTHYFALKAHLYPLQFRRTMKTLWHFNSDTTISWNDKVSSLEFPLWLAQLPCLIAPAIWLRRRRRRRRENRQGFEVLSQPSDASHTPPSR